MNPANRAQALLDALTRQRDAANNRIVQLEAELTVLQQAYTELEEKTKDANTPSSTDGSEGDSGVSPELGA